MSSETQFRTVIDAFETWVRRAPTAVALRTVDTEATYDELNQAANRSAHAILGHVGPRQLPIGVAVADDVEYTAAMIGVLKSANILMPLSLDDPPERIRDIVERADTRLVITDDAQGDRFDTLDLPGVSILRLREIPTDPVSNPACEIEPTQAATLMFTSGSTGSPKGVARPHSAWVTGSRYEPIAVGPTDRFSQLHPPSFSPAFGNTFRAFSAGATLCRFDVRRSGVHRLARWIDENRLTVLNMGPALLRNLLSTIDPDTRFDTVRAVFTAAAPLLRGDVDMFRRHFPPTTPLVNVLATAENGIVSTFVVARDTVVTDAVVPVGYPVPGVEVLVLDEAGEPVPAGTPGILHVASESSTDGYWRDPERTQASFSPHPGGANRRMYRSGDLVTQAEDGCLRYIGRSDDRVKVRGYAVDLTEVEAAIGSLDRVKEGVVIPVAEAGDHRLSAFLVATDPASPPDHPSLRRLLAERLPSYAIPSTFVILETLPMTVRGKVDRRALAAHLPDEAQRSWPIALPVDELEQSLVEIWEGVLGMAPIGVDDHFFDMLGGSSMQGLQVFAEIARKLDRDLAPTVLLEAPTVSKLAAILRTGQGAPRQTSLLPIRTDGSLAPFVCIHGAGGGAFFVRDLGAIVDPDRPVYAVQASGFDGLPPPYRPVEEIAARYLSELRTERPTGPYILGGLSFGGLVSLEMGKQMVAAGDDPPLLVMLDAHHSSSRDEPVAPQLDWQRHLRRIRDASPLGALRYLVGGARRRLVHRWRMLRIMVRVRLGKRLPPALRDYYFWQIHARAVREYSPAPYPGPVLFFASEGRGEFRTAQWQPFVDGAFEVIELPVDHFDLHLQPGLEALEPILEERLRRLASPDVS
jgi:amino acid adenylation domain-containing protein